MKTLLVLNLSPDLEEDMVDYLLPQEGVGGFTSYRVRGHGHHADMSLAEQVSGRRKRQQFEIIIEESEVDNLLAGLVNNVGKDILCWQQAKSKVGRI